MAEYILDLTQAELPAWWPEQAPRVIPVRDGRWYCDFDVIEDRIPGFRGLIKLAQWRYSPTKYGCSCKVIPIGFYFNALPVGAKLSVHNQCQ